MTHCVRAHRDRDDRPWWVCDRCGDRWRHPPSDICDDLLARLEAEEYAGWRTVTPSRLRLEQLLAVLADAVKSS